MNTLFEDPTSQVDRYDIILWRFNIPHETIEMLRSDS